MLIFQNTRLPGFIFTDFLIFNQTTEMHDHIQYLSNLCSVRLEVVQTLTKAKYFMPKHFYGCLGPFHWHIIRNKYITMFEHESLNNLVLEQVQTHENLDFKRLLVAVTFKKH